MSAEKTRVVDLITLIAYAFEKDEFHVNAERFFEKVEAEGFETCVLDITALEAEALYLTRTIRVTFKEWAFFIKAILENPKLIKIPITPEIFTEHTRLYEGYGGGHTYFDSFHGAAARILKAPLVTADEILLADKTIPTEDLRAY